MPSQVSVHSDVQPFTTEKDLGSNEKGRDWQEHRGTQTFRQLSRLQKKSNFRGQNIKLSRTEYHAIRVNSKAKKAGGNILGVPQCLLVDSSKRRKAGSNISFHGNLEA